MAIHITRLNGGDITIGAGNEEPASKTWHWPETIGSGNTIAYKAESEDWINNNGDTSKLYYIGNNAIQFMEGPNMWSTSMEVYYYSDGWELDGGGAAELLSDPGKSADDTEITVTDGGWTVTLQLY